MKPLLSLLIFFTTMPVSAAIAWNCKAELDGKNVPLTAIDQGFQLNYPDPEHNYALISHKDKFQFVYINSSSNKKNFLRYSMNCAEDKVSCLGNFDSSYNDVKTQRPLLSAVSSRSTQMLDKNKSILEYSKSQDSLDIHLTDPELIFRCSK